MTQLARENGLGHWRCVSPNSNAWWIRDDGKECTHGLINGTVWDTLHQFDELHPITETNKDGEVVASKEETDRINRAVAAARIQLYEEEIGNLEHFAGRTRDTLTSTTNRIALLKRNVLAERESVKE